jgi:DNA polymerase-3 subunit epsilon
MWPYPGAIMLEERDMQEPEIVAFHVIHNWRYIAKLTLIEDLYDHGYQLTEARNNQAGNNDYQGITQNLKSDTTPAIPTPSDDRFDLDIYFILVRFLVDAEKMKMHNLKIWPLMSCSTDV